MTVLASEPLSERADDIVEHLDARVAELLEKIKQSEIYKTLTAPETDPAVLRAVMREVYLEIYSYQPHVIEATISIIARMPKDAPKMMQTMLIHQAEEADHGEMAMRDYVALGGDEKYARSRRISPASFAVASLWWGLCKMEDPFCYLGAEYLFERMTPIISQLVMTPLQNKAFPPTALEFMQFHATEDIKHTNMVKKLIERVAKNYPHADEAIRYGLECFLAVYPLPVWMTAYRRALEVGPA